MHTRHPNTQIKDRPAPADPATAAWIEGNAQTLVAAMMNGTDPADLPVGADDFPEGPAKTIYSRARGLKKRGLLAVTDALRRNGQLKKVGGAAEVTKIFNSVHDEDAVNYALGEVKRASRTRQMQKLGEQMTGGDITPERAHAQLGTLIEKPSNGFTVRNARDILSLKLDPHDCLLGDRLLTKAGRLVMAGQAGIGKSRLFLQLAVACIIGRAFGLIETHAKNLRWLILQTENSNRRLQDDLDALKKWAGKYWSLVEDQLLIHTLETDSDSLLFLSDPNTVRQLESIIQKTNPDIVGADPLRDFGVGNLDTDEGMLATVNPLGQMCRAGNPNRALALLHHAITGKAGAAKATGYERSGFARNSKVLLSWTRGQINVAPGSSEDNSVLVLACGKSNDGKEFPHFAVRLNPDTMIYEVDHDFDIEAWKEEVTSTSAAKKRLSPQLLRDILADGRDYDKKQIVKLIIDDKGICKSRAYTLVDEGQKRGVLRYNKVIKTYALA